MIWGWRHYSKTVAGTSERVIFPFMSHPKQKTRRVWGPLTNESKRQRDGTAVDSQNTCVTAGSAERFPLSTNHFSQKKQNKNVKLFTPAPTKICKRRTTQINVSGCFDRMLQVLSGDRQEEFHLLTEE